RTKDKVDKGQQSTDPAELPKIMGDARLLLQQEVWSPLQSNYGENRAAPGIRSLLEAPLLATGTVMMHEQHQAQQEVVGPQLMAAVAQELSGPFNQKIAPFYPFGSGPDINPLDFKEFFAPGGTFDAFYNTHL